MNDPQEAAKVLRTFTVQPGGDVIEADTFHTDNNRLEFYRGGVQCVCYAPGYWRSVTEVFESP